MKLDKKGQSALEYLMTYGWALVVIVVVVAVLYALGVFNIGGSIETCTGFPAGQFTYGSHQYKANGDFNLQFTNGPKEIKLESLKVAGTSKTLGAIVTSGSTGYAGSTGFPVGTSGGAYNVDAVLTYNITSGLNGLTASLKCTGKYQ